MRNLSAAAACVASVLVAAGALLAQVPRPAAGGIETMAVDDVRPGMRGYGLTVFRGTRPERFDVEVLDTIHNFRPHMDLILIRPTHPTLEHAGTVGGMSGSPIFIEGKLIGAYAYGWEFGRDPVAGVTPIASMLAELRRPRRTPSGVIPGSGIPFDIAPTPISAPRARWESLSQSALAHRAPVATAYGSLVPAMTPMAITGMGERATQHLAESLAPFGIVPLQGAGGGGAARPPDDAPARFENGGAVGVRMVQGDISGNITGTVTLVTPEGVLAFGHPMMGLGETSFPATIARVMWILASERRSFKISEPVRAMGALINDRGSAVVVDPRATAPTIPMRVSIHGVDGAPHTDWNVTLAAQRPMAARLAASVVESALEDTVSDMADAAWTVQSRVFLRGRGPVEFTEHGAGAEGVRSLPAPGGLDLLTRLVDNAFGSVPVDRIEVDLTLRWQRDFSYVRSVSADVAEVDPGGAVELSVVLGRYGAGPERRTVRVEVPRELAGRELDIEVAGGTEVVPDLAEPETLDDLIRNVATRYPGDALVVSVRMPSQGVTLHGRVIPNLPNSALDALRPSASTESGDPFQSYRRTVVPVGRVVLGRDRVRLRVREVRL
ncbi:MAG: hypothetical protein JWM10_3387 [Myxococcaceae bacterium]|nr:hypothetical protein [Myxococcaceae bacterium]